MQKRKDRKKVSTEAKTINKEETKEKRVGNQEIAGKQIAIAVRSGKPVPRYLEQDMERRRG